MMKVRKTTEKEMKHNGKDCVYAIEFGHYKRYFTQKALVELGDKINSELKEKVPSKGDWKQEYSSGYHGFRCQNCNQWEYGHKELKCKCDKGNKC